MSNQFLKALLMETRVAFRSGKDGSLCGGRVENQRCCLLSGIAETLSRSPTLRTPLCCPRLAKQLGGFRLLCFPKRGTKACRLACKREVLLTS